MQSSSSDGFLAVLVDVSSTDNTTSFANAVTAVEVTSVVTETPTYSSSSQSNTSLVLVLVVICAGVVSALAVSLCCRCRKRPPSLHTSYHQMEGAIQGGASKLPLETKEGSGTGASTAVMSNV